MSNKTQLQTNNTNLDALITRVNAAKDTAASLPEGGSNSEIKTCTVKIINECVDLGAYISIYEFVQLVNGEIQTRFYNPFHNIGDGELMPTAQEQIFTNVVCDTKFTIWAAGYNWIGYTITGSYSQIIDGEAHQFITSKEAGSLCTLYIQDDY